MNKLLLFIILRILSNSMSNFMQKKLAQRNSSLTVNLWGYMILSLICLPALPKILSAGYSYNYWINVITAGFLCSAGTLCIIKSVNLGELSVIGPINSYKCIVGLVFSIILLKEIPSLYGLIGMVMIIFGSKYIFESLAEGFSFGLLKRKDIQLRFSALILTGIEAAILKKIILLSDVQTCFILWCFSGFFWALIFLLIFGKKIKLDSDKSLIFCILTALCMGLMQYSTNYVFKFMNVGYALALFQISSLVTVFLGVKYFNEKNLLRKVAGCIIMILGSCFILFST